MNEHQYDHGLDSHRQDYNAQQHSITDTAANHSQDHASTDLTQQEYLAQSAWEQQNQLGHDLSQNHELHNLGNPALDSSVLEQNTLHHGQDYSSFQDQYNHTLEQEYLNQNQDSYLHDNYHSSYGQLETHSASSGSGIPNQTTYSDLYNQGNNHSEVQNPAEMISNTQDYNSQLWEQQFQHHSSFDGGMNSSQQRSGHEMITINNLSKDHKIGDIVSENGKEYKVVDYSPIHGGYDVIPVEHYPDGTYKEQGSTNTFLPKANIDT
jgi:hypothetical protein